MTSIARMLDANANRAREAMRVMEDAARFALDDAALSESLKRLRHELRTALDALPIGWMEANRDTSDDVGTAISTPAEQSRANLAEIVIAAGKRLTEALRVMEECAKTIEPETARRIETIRYRSYELDQQLALRLAPTRVRQWRVCLLLTRELCRKPWRDVLRATLAGGVDCVQVREKRLDGGDLTEHVREVLAMARPAGAAVIVNDRADVAMACGADGVHVGQSDLGVRDVRRLAGHSLLVGVSTHDMGEAERAIADGADYCGVGAMFASTTKQREVSGEAFLKAFIARFPHMPHLAIGGITQDNVGQLAAAGARGIAVSSAVCAADDAERVVRALRNALDRGQENVDERMNERLSRSVR